MFNEKKLMKGAVALSIILLTVIIVLLSNTYEVYADSWFNSKEADEADEFELHEHYNKRAIEILQGDLPESGEETFNIMRFNRLIFEDLDMLYDASLEDQGKAIAIAYILNPYEQMPGDYSDVKDLIEEIKDKNLRAEIDKIAELEAGDSYYEEYEDEFDEDYIDEKTDNPVKENNALEDNKSNSPSVLKLMLIAILLITITTIIVIKVKKKE